MIETDVYISEQVLGLFYDVDIADAHSEFHRAETLAADYDRELFLGFWAQVAIAALIRELEKSHEFIDYESSWWVA